MLDELASRARDGRIEPLHAARIRPAVTRLQGALDAAVRGPGNQSPAVPAPCCRSSTAARPGTVRSAPSATPAATVRWTLSRRRVAECSYLRTATVRAQAPGFSILAHCRYASIIASWTRRRTPGA